MKNLGHNAPMNYIDYLIYIGLPLKIHDSYNQLLPLLDELGLEVSKPKLIPPPTSAVCLGIEADTVKCTLSIPHEKLIEIKHYVRNGFPRKNSTKNQFQSLLGSLLYITRCIRPTRIFLSKMLQILDNALNNCFAWPQEFFQDFNWFTVSLHQFNGITFYDNHLIHHEVNLNASLSECRI